MQAKSQNNMATSAKTQTKKKKQSVIPLADRKKIAQAYYQFYHAFLLKNLLDGMTLGAASHNAMQMVRAKIATLDKDSPVAKYLLHINARHAKRVAKRIMTGKYRDAPAIASPETRAKVNAFITKNFAEANKTLNTMAAQYKPKTPAKAPQVQKPQLVAAAARVENAKPNAQQQKVGNLAPKMPQEQPANIIKFIFLQNGRGSQKAA